MSNVNILNLPVAVALSGQEYTVVVQSNVTKRVQTSLFGNLASLPTVASNTVLANTTGSPAQPIATTVSAILDTIGATQGQILYRAGSGWVALNSGTTGQALITQGAGAAPIWATATAAAGGNDTQVQVNSTGSLAGYAAFTYAGGTLGLGVSGATKGAITLSGNTSGTVSVLPAAASGTYNFNLPTSAGTSGQPLLSGGGGATAMSFGTLSVPGGGTGAATLTNRGLLVGAGTSAITSLAAAVAGTVLVGLGVTFDPAFSATPTLGIAGTTAGTMAFSGVTSGTTTLQSATIASGVLTLPAATDTLVGKATTDTFTNKSISGATNTLSNIANAALTNSSVTIGSTSVSLGATAATVAGLTLTAPTINGGAATSLTGLAIRSTGAAFDLTFATSEVLTAGRTLSWVLNDAARTITVPATGTLALLGTANAFTAAQTIGVNGGTNGQITLNGSTSGSVALRVAAVAGTSTVFQLPATNGLNTYVLQTDGTGVTSWVASAGGLIIGTTTITSGTSGRLLYDNAGVVGESANLTFATATLTLGVAASATGVLTLANATSGSAILTADAANTLALRNSTNAQTFRTYGTFVDPSNFAFGFLDAGVTTANTLTIGTSGLGTGATTLSKMQFRINGINVFDYGVTQASVLTLQGSLIASAGSVIAAQVSGASYLVGSAGAIYPGTTGIFTFYNQTQTGWDRLQLGGTSSAFPAIGRDGAGIKFVAADNTNVSWIKIPPVAIASLPAAATAGNGARSHVTDALAPTFGSTVTAGGSVSTPVYSDGSVWKVG